MIALDLQLPSGGCRIAWVSGRPEASLVPKVVDPVLSGPTHAMPANERIDGIAVNSLEIIEQGKRARKCRCQAISKSLHRVLSLQDASSSVNVSRGYAGEANPPLPGSMVAT